MDAPFPQLAADAVSMTLHRCDDGYFRLVISSHVRGLAWDPRMRSNYTELSGTELLDVVFAELASRIGIL